MLTFLLIQDKNKNTMLHICAQNNLKKMAALCIDNGCDINAVNGLGMTPLDLCDRLQFKGMAEWLVVMGADNGSIMNLPHTPTYDYDSGYTTRSMR